MLIVTISSVNYLKSFLLHREESATKSNVSSQMLFILQVLRELTLPSLTDTEITSTGVDIKV